MMDLSERLRFHGRYAAESQDECAARKCREREEAADEIERLREASQLALIHCDFDGTGGQRALDALRHALEKSATAHEEQG